MLKYIVIISCITALCIVSCNNQQKDSRREEVVNKKAIVAYEVSTDTINKLIPDKYPITNEMLRRQQTDNYSSFQKVSGETYSFDKAWFRNEALRQVLICELYTDYFRVATYCFYDHNIPADIMEKIEFHTNTGDIAMNEQKIKDLQGFIDQAVIIDSAYFISKKGFKLGDSKQKILDIYGTPDMDNKTDGVEKLEWRYIGDLYNEDKKISNNKPLAKDSFGHQVVMYFRNSVLVGYILHNDIP